MFGGIYDAGKSGWKLAYGFYTSSVASGSFALQCPTNGTNLSAIGYPTSAGAFNQVIASKADIKLVTSQLFDYSVAADQIKLRTNGLQAAQASGSIASSGFGASHKFQMAIDTAECAAVNIYQLVILGRLATSSEITNTEAYIAAKTGVTLP